MYDYDRRAAGGALPPDKKALVEKQLAAYGYSLSPNNEIMKGEKSLKVMVSAKGPRFYATQQSGAKLWSGPDLGNFVSNFWHAKKI
jgi:hypothetical protein